MSEQFSFIVGSNWNCWAYEPPTVRSDGTQLLNNDVWWESDTAVARVYLNGQWSTPTNQQPGVYAIQAAGQSFNIAGETALVSPWGAPFMNLNEFTFNGTNGFICSEANTYVINYDLQLTQNQNMVYTKFSGGGGASQIYTNGQYLSFITPIQQPVFVGWNSATRAFESTVTNGYKGVYEFKLYLNVNACAAASIVLEVNGVEITNGGQLWYNFSHQQAAEETGYNCSCRYTVNIGDTVKFKVVGGGGNLLDLDSDKCYLEILNCVPQLNQNAFTYGTPISNVSAAIKVNGIALTQGHTPTVSVIPGQKSQLKGSLRTALALNDVVTIEVTAGKGGITLNSAMLNISPDP